MKRARLGAWCAAALSLSAACASADHAPNEAAVTAPRYLVDQAYRRTALEASLVSPQNGYSALRLAKYATGDGQGWDALPEWNPAVEPAVGMRELHHGAQTAIGADARALAIDPRANAGDEAALRDLGEAAFFRYPAQLVASVGLAVASTASAAKYGLWTDETRGVGGIVRAALPDGSGAFAFTCATCHADERNDTLVVGVGNAHFDMGRLAFDASAGASGALLDWGPGRIDVTTLDGREPVRIPDLRPVRWLTHLQQDATIVQRDRDALAIRIETLIITSHGQATRPPRVIALALATYVWSLASTVIARPVSSDAEIRGATLFSEHCARCHAPPALTGPPVPLAVVGTDPSFGNSSDRGTGTYRVPSLHGVSTRGFLFHDASITSLETFLDPTRTSDAFRSGTRPGPVPGHVFGLDLDAASRSDLASYLRTL